MGSSTYLWRKVRRIDFEMACPSLDENLAFSKVTKTSKGEIPTSKIETDSSKATLDRALQRGSIESGLVLIPTTIFFLMALQVLLAGSWQTIERARLHDLVIESSLKESIGGSQQSLNENSTYLSGDGLSKLNGTFDGERSTLIVEEEFTPVGTIRTVEKSTKLPILGDFFRSIDRGVFQVRNYAVSFIN